MKKELLYIIGIYIGLFFLIFLLIVAIRLILTGKKTKIKTKDYKGDLAETLRFIINLYHRWHSFWAFLLFVSSIILLSYKWVELGEGLHNLIYNMVADDHRPVLEGKTWLEFAALICECLLFSCLLVVLFSKGTLYWVIRRGIWEGEFFKKNFVAGSSADKEQMIRQFDGKRFGLYSHSLYHETVDTRKTREHLLSISYLKFGERYGNSLTCQYFTTSRKREIEDNSVVRVDLEYLYEGVATFGEEGKNILILLKPKGIRKIKQAEQDQDEFQDYSKSLHKDNTVHPIVISGKVELVDGEVLSADGYLPFRNHNITEEEMTSQYEQFKKCYIIPLHITQYSHSHESTLTKIGLLSMIDLDKLSLRDKVDKSYTATFRNLEPHKCDNKFEMLIKLYLMRSSKVLVKSLPGAHAARNTAVKINNWFNDNYSLFKNGENEFELFYKKKVHTKNAIETKRVSIKFLKNGIALLERVREIEGQPKVEKYFGEINIRHNIDGEKYLYIKFIANKYGTKATEDHSGIIQNYRELFMILFWNENRAGSKPFDFTRGIVLGDKDIEPNVNPKEPVDCHYINSNVCVLARRTPEWKNYYADYEPKQQAGTIPKVNVPDAKLEQLQKFEAPERLTKIDATFLSKVLYHDASKEDRQEIEKLREISLEIKYNEDKMCTFKSVWD